MFFALHVPPSHVPSAPSQKLVMARSENMAHSKEQKHSQHSRVHKRNEKVVVVRLLTAHFLAATVEWHILQRLATFYSRFASPFGGGALHWPFWADALRDDALYAVLCSFLI